MIPPQTILDNRYEIVRLLGEGAFARVYLAKHISLLSQHAVKVLNEEFAVQPDVRARFLSEGRIQAQLRHPHLVIVTDIISDPPALVMDYIQGTPLDEWRTALGRPLLPEEVLAIMVPVLEAIGTVHCAGIVHRDIKPENIIVSRDNKGRLRPMVSDFGIAKVSQGSTVSSGKRKTEAGQRLGTPAYMSPEQVRGDPNLDARSDVFALGVLLYEIAAGNHPFCGPNDFETMRNIVDGRRLPMGAIVPDAVQQCVDRALALDPGARFADCAEFRLALESAYGDEPTQSASGVYRIPDSVGRSRGTKQIEPAQMPTNRESAAPPQRRATPVPIPPKRSTAPPAAQSDAGETNPEARTAPPSGAGPTWVIPAILGGFALLVVAAAGLGIIWFQTSKSGAVSPSLSQSQPNQTAPASGPQVPAAPIATSPPQTATVPAESSAFIKVAPGQFTMGAPVGAEGRFKDEIEHAVTVSRRFSIAATEVTQAEWERVMPTDPSASRGPTLPVESITWLEAVAFCNALSASAGRQNAYSVSGTSVNWDENASGFRLPTEAEWEFAARAGAGSIFSGGADPTTVAWLGANSGSATHPVGQLLANNLGAKDMSGNVGEWVWDRYGDYSTTDSTDPSGPATGETRVIRGGGFKDTARAVRVSYRKAALPANRAADVGFRVVVNGEAQ